MMRTILFASALMIGGAALAQDAPPPADTAPAMDTAPAAATPPAAEAAPAAATDSSYPPCSAKVQDHCIQGMHSGSSHKSAKRSHHKAH